MNLNVLPGLLLAFLVASPALLHAETFRVAAYNVEN